MKRAEVTWGPVPAVIMTIVLFLFSQVLAAVLLIVGLLVFTGSIPDDFQSNGTYQFISTVLVASILVGSLYLFVRLAHSKFRALGLYRTSVKKVLGYVSLGALIYFSIALFAGIIVSILWPDLLAQEQDIGFSRSATGLALIPIFISLVVLPPIAEELLSRGFLFGGLRSKLNFWYSALVTSLIFAMAHLQWGNSTPLVWAAAIDTFILSMVLCWQRERTGSLWAPIGLHALKNSLAFATIFIFR